MQTSKVRPEPKIPDHEVLRKIGGGAYGEVWLAQGVTGALRAVKTVWHNDFEDERGFEREFEGILKYEPISRDHPGLVHILHVGRAEAEDEPFYYYVMELGDDILTGREINPVEYEARTLRSDMKAANGAPLDVEECISAGRVLAEGLEHLHHHGLAHRDVKPSNVIFVDGKAKLADIGLVAQRGQQTFVGTEGFVPPEGPGSAQADVYSLGKVLYEMATGKDRLEFPELPDELPEGPKLKRWRALNSVICDVCEPKISRRKIKFAGDLAAELAHLEAGRRRPVRVRRGIMAAGLAAAIGVVGATQILNWSSVEIPAVPPQPVRMAPVEMAVVSITSTPEGAMVLGPDGAPLGFTPLEPMKIAVGTEVSYTLMKPGHRPVPILETVPKGVFILEKDLPIYSPPRPGDPWEDIFRTRYKPVEDYHISNNYVGADVWMEYEERTKRKVGKIAELTEAGVANQVVLATRQEANQFVKWLQKECADGYLEDDNWLEVRFDNTREMPEVDPALLKQGRRPFYTVVKKEPKALIRISTEPPGATVYLNGERIGETSAPPFEYLKAEVRAGSVEIIIELKDHKQYMNTLQLKPNEVWDEPLHIELIPDNIFLRPLTNSLAMELVPVGQELLASIWETRVRDYEVFVETQSEFLKKYGDYVKREKNQDQRKKLEKAYKEYVEASKDSVEAPPAPGFMQNGDHPVVNVTKDDADLFCRWLTIRDRMAGIIAENHEYRLPTDLEWSMLAGLRDERGEWPVDRHGVAPDFPWGQPDVWIPPAGVGNFSDESVREADPEEIALIDGFYDGFEKTAPVGTFTSNRLKLYDISGNVHEWVSDDYSKNGTHNVARGGGWNSYRREHLKTSARTFVRKSADPSNYFGFRVVLAKVPVIREKDPDQANNP